VGDNFNTWPLGKQHFFLVRHRPDLKIPQVAFSEYFGGCSEIDPLTSGLCSSGVRWGAGTRSWPLTPLFVSQGAFMQNIGQLINHKRIFLISYPFTHLITQQLTIRVTFSNPGRQIHITKNNKF
jgi:hypothetical protein